MKDVLGGIGAGMRAIWFDNPESFPRQLCGQAVPQECSYLSVSRISKPMVW